MKYPDAVGVIMDEVSLIPVLTRYEWTVLT